jgi:hypothetical protein
MTPVDKALSLIEHRLADVVLRNQVARFANVSRNAAHVRLGDRPVGHALRACAPAA